MLLIDGGTLNSEIRNRCLAQTGKRIAEITEREDGVASLKVKNKLLNNSSLWLESVVRK